MVLGSHGIHISGISCGPGHGISIESLGKSKEVKETVTGITITNCTLTGTQNGIDQDVGALIPQRRIGFDLPRDPHGGCAYNSEVQISNVTFKNIWGSSRSKVAVNLKCSGIAPCQNIKLVKINLSYNGHGGPAISCCSNVQVGVTWFRDTVES
ncbi:exopolygalacturonase-like [Actinidia eriantha]|uniref:exopolygalacturonase-like n=1 Tax=Actinidia eriantha TaxID=165200 RepID=UPI00258FBCB1|nr:exopolygalacturonase-like [Actinidia eriantha]